MPEMRYNEHQVRRVSKMISNERMEELKRNSELILEFIEIINKLSIQVEVLRKEKQYYMDEYKKVSDSLHDMRRQKENKGNNKCTIVKCENRYCLHISNGVCQSHEIEFGKEGYCLMAEQNPMSEC